MNSIIYELFIQAKQAIQIPTIRWVLHFTSAIKNMAHEKLASYITK